MAGRGGRPSQRGGAGMAPARVEDLALGTLVITEGLVPPILSRLGVPGQVLTAAILDRGRPTC